LSARAWFLAGFDFKLLVQYLNIFLNLFESSACL